MTDALPDSDPPEHSAAPEPAAASEEPPLSAADSAEPSLRPPGPGLAEAVGWTVGVLLVHIVGGIVALLVVFAGNMPAMDDLEERITSLPPAELVTQIGIEQAIFVAVVLVAAALRLSARSPGRLSLRPVSWLHLFIILALILPVVVLSAGLAAPFSPAEGETEIGVMTMVRELVGHVPIPLLVLILAVAPAVGEEVIFRGVIGRGLVARWGIPMGVLLTALLFAAAHVEPAHILRVVPLGIVIHLIYLATRSLWAPMLYHFLNNGLALVAAMLAADEPGAGQLDDPQLPLWAVTASALCVAALLALLWQTRVNYRLPDGTLWSPGYPTPERPPGHMQARAERPAAALHLLAAAAGSLLLFWTALILSGAQALGE